MCASTVTSVDRIELTVIYSNTQSGASVAHTGASGKTASAPVANRARSGPSASWWKGPPRIGTIPQHRPVVGPKAPRARRDSSPRNPSGSDHAAAPVGGNATSPTGSASSRATAGSRFSRSASSSLPSSRETGPRAMPSQVGSEITMRSSSAGGSSASGSQPLNWPESVGRFWLQAHRSCSDENWDADAVMARSAVQAAMRDRDARGRNLRAENSTWEYPALRGTA